MSDQWWLARTINADSSWGGVRAVAVNSQSLDLASAGDDHGIKIIDITRNRIVSTLKGHTGSIRSLVFTPDGKTLVSGSDDSRILLWDRFEKKQIGEIRSHTKSVTTLAILKSNNLLLVVVMIKRSKFTIYEVSKK